MACRTTMRSRHRQTASLSTSLSLSLLALGGCTCASAEPHAPLEVPSGEPAPASRRAPTYEVHEWGLLRGTIDDRAMLSGPHAEAPPMPLAKPVLYFHREGEGALVVDVEARMTSGRIVEHWPSPGGEAGTRASWQGVTIQEGSCRGSRYPTLSEDPCTRATDGCEASLLAVAETSDADCLFWPRPPDDDGPTQAWNHLFYRGAIEGTPPLPLRVEPLPDGSIRVVAAEGGSTIPGRLLRVRRANGEPGATDAIAIADAPVPGASVVIAAPRDPIATGPEALAEALRTAGLTYEETNAFRRAWDETIFGTTTIAAGEAPATTIPAAASPLAGVLTAPRATTSLVYVLPAGAVDALATLTFDPPPTAVRRAIVFWLDER